MIRIAALAALLLTSSCGQVQLPGGRHPRGQREPRAEEPAPAPPPAPPPAKPSAEQPLAGAPAPARRDPLPPAGGTVVFGAIADCQYADQPDAGERRYRAASAKLREAVDALDRETLSFSVHLGDFIDKGWSSYREVEPIFAGLRAPGYHLLGNHDFAVPDAFKGAVPERLGIPERYRSFSLGGWRFILLDGNDVSLHAHADGGAAQADARAFRDAVAPGAPDWNGGLGIVQLLWLDSMLAEADAAGEKAVVMNHFPVLPAGPHALWNAAEVLGVLASHRSPRLYLAGHDHAGSYVEQGGVHFLTLRAMLDGEQNAWSTIRLGEREIRVDGNGREPDRTLTIR